MQFHFENHALDVERRELRRGSELIAIEPQVFDLLTYLVQNRDRVVTKDDMIAAVWSGRIVSESTLTSRINAVRKAVGDSGDEQRLIRTIARKGIRFVGEVSETAAQRATGTGARPPVAPVPLHQEVHFCTAERRRSHRLRRSWQRNSPAADRPLADASGVRLGEPGVEFVPAGDRRRATADPLRRARQRPLGLGGRRDFFRSVRARYRERGRGNRPRHNSTCWACRRAPPFPSPMRYGIPNASDILCSMADLRAGGACAARNRRSPIPMRSPP